MTLHNIYALPSLTAFVEKICEAAFDDGLAIVRRDPTLPDGLEDAVADKLRQDDQQVKRLQASLAEPPHEAVARLLGCAPTLEAICADRFTDTVVILQSDSAPLAWETFLGRLLKARRTNLRGAKIIWAGAPFTDFHDADVAWDARLRRADAAIWADLHASSRKPVLEGLAAALAIELCGWRLDLAARLVRLRSEDLLDPLDWLEAQKDMDAIEGKWRFAGKEMSCPLWLYDDCAEKDDFTRLTSRVWRAQLIALFPWMEDQRWELARKHRRWLKIDAVAEEQGLESVDDLEFGAVKWQLNNAHGVPDVDKRLAWRLSNVRNKLAHRQPADPEDLSVLMFGEAP